MAEIRVPMVRPGLGEVEAEAAARVVRSGWVAQGPEVAAFEAELAAAVGATHAVAVANGTVALELALRALGVGPGDDVVTVSHSFIATTNVVHTVGARPVFVDVERDTYGMDPALLPAALTPRTKAVLCVHQLGFPCAIERIVAIADQRGIPVIEDAACALGTEVRMGGAFQRIGRPYGRIACFSFHPRKIITTGDGGMVTTNDAQLAARCRSLRQHAATSTAEARDRNPLASEAYLEPAYNFRLTDLAAAVGRPQLARLDQAISERRRLAAVYAEALAGHPALVAPTERPDARCNWQSYPVTVRPAGAWNQDRVLRHLHDRGIASRRGLTNAHQEPAYAARGSWGGGPLPVSESLRDNTVMLPLFHGMTAPETDEVLSALREIRG